VSSSDAVRPGDAPAALARYAAIRRERVRRVHEVSRQNATMLHLADGDGQRRRDRVLAETADIRGQDWLYGYDPEAEIRDTG